MRASSVLPDTKAGREVPPPSASEVARLLAERIETLSGELVGEKPTEKRAATWRFRTRGSLQVFVGGNKRGKWKDHEGGEYGDALALVAHLRRCSMADAYGWALSWLGLEPNKGGGHSAAPERPAPVIATVLQRLGSTSEAQPPVAKHTTENMARQLWHEGQPAACSPVSAYLASRGLTLPANVPLRFHPACPRGAERLPAMLALMTDPATAEPCGVHRTFLAPDGRGKAPGNAKMMAGRAGVVRLVPDVDVGDGLGLAEGIETALAVMQGFGWRPVWAATSAGGIARFPVLLGTEALTIFADADDGGAGAKAAERCGEAWTAAGREVRILAAPAGTDFHDALGMVA